MRPQVFKVTLHLERLSASKPLPESRLRRLLSECLCMENVDIEVEDIGE